jgi:hypothetical protein
MVGQIARRGKFQVFGMGRGRNNHPDPRRVFNRARGSLFMASLPA